MFLLQDIHRRRRSVGEESHSADHDVLCHVRLKRKTDRWSGSACLFSAFAKTSPEKEVHRTCCLLFRGRARRTLTTGSYAPCLMQRPPITGTFHPPMRVEMKASGTRKSLGHWHRSGSLVRDSQWEHPKSTSDVSWSMKNRWILLG